VLKFKCKIQAPKG